MNPETEFVLEKEKKKQPGTAAIAGSWWWANVKPFVDAGSASVATRLQFILLHIVGHYYHINVLKAFKEAPPDLKLSLSKPDPEKFKAVLKRQPVLVPLEAVMNSMALGSFEILTKKVTASNRGVPVSILQEACCAVFAGFIGACTAAPPLLAESYIKSMENLPKPKYVGYRNAFETLYHVGAKQGVSVLWKHGAYHVKRSGAFYLGMLMPYNRSYDYLKVSCDFDDTRAWLGAGAVSAFFAAACSLPVVNVQRIMKHMKPSADGKYPCTGSLDCAWKIFRTIGFLALYRGFPGYLARSTGRVMLLWLMLGEIRKLEEYNGISHTDS